MSTKLSQYSLKELTFPAMKTDQWQKKVGFEIFLKHSPELEKNHFLLCHWVPVITPLYNVSTLQGSCPREVLCPGFSILRLGTLCTGDCYCDSQQLTGKCGNLLKPLNSQCWGWSFTYKMELGCVCVERSLLTTKASLTIPSPPFSLPPSLSSARARPFVL